MRLRKRKSMVEENSRRSAKRELKEEEDEFYEFLSLFKLSSYPFIWFLISYWSIIFFNDVIWHHKYKVIIFFSFLLFSFLIFLHNFMFLIHFIYFNLSYFKWHLGQNLTLGLKWPKCPSLCLPVIFVCTDK